ncbi:DUF5689 domain-containing protein [Caldithrix abyssi]
MTHKFIRMTFILFSAFSLIFAQNAWINEIHYDNFGTDEGEFIEVVIENVGNYNLTDFAVDLYNGNDGAVYDTKTLDQFVQGATVGDFTFFYYTYPTNGLQNGSPDGMALSYQGAVISGQFLSYEGTLTATNGPASGMTSVDIMVSEPDSVGYSLQLGGSGTTYDAFAWQQPLPATPGDLNQNQELSATVKPEPSNHVTDFTVDSVKTYSVYLSWTGATGSVLPDKYLLLGVKDGVSFPTVADGNPIADDADATDGLVAFNVLHQDGKNTFTVTGLESETPYSFRIYPYTNAGSNVDFKTDGAIPEVSATTLAAQIFAIAQVQKTADGMEGDSPLLGQVVTVEGVVTAVSSRSFWIQDADSAWSGVNVFDADAVSQVKLGDRVRLTGVVDEYFGKTEIKDLSAFTILSQNEPLPNPISLPTGQVPQEKYEGVLVTVNNATCTNPDLGYGEWEVDDGSGPCRVDDLIFQFAPEQGKMYTVTGVVEYSYSNYKIEPRSEADVALISNAPVISFIGSSALAPMATEDFIDTVKVVDNGTVVQVELRYRVNAGDTVSVAMTGSDSIFVGVIPASAYNDGDKVEYWIYAIDNDNEVSVSDVRGFFAGTTPIAVLKQLDDQGVLIVDGFYARTTGVATVSNGVFDTSHLSVFMQDENYSAINIFKYNGADFTFTEGHSYTVVGKLTQYRGLTEIIPENLQTDIIDNGEATMPEPLTVTLSVLLSSPESLEGLLVRVENADTVAGAGQWPEPGNNANLTITDDGGATQITFRIDKDTDIDDASAPTWPQTIVGIFSQYDSQAPYLDGYQILPRSTADLSGLTGIESPGQAIVPQRISLQPAFPNPFNPSTTLSVEIPAKIAGKETVYLEIYNVLGQKVATLINGQKLTAGRHQFKWQATADNGLQVPTGIYFAVLKVSNKIWTQKLILLK